MSHTILIIRTIISQLLCWVIFFIFGIIGLIHLPFIKKTNPNWGTNIVSYCTRACHVCIKIVCGLNYQVKGQEYLDLLQNNNEPYLVVSNHQSTWETLIFQFIFPKSTFLIKKELLNIPFFGWSLSMLNPVSINRSQRVNALKIIIKEGKMRLQQGYNFITFPEGTRQPPNEIGKYNHGSIRLGQSSGVKIVPVVNNAANFWSIKSPWIFSGTIQVIISEPIESKDFNTRELTQAIEDWSREQLKEVNSEKTNFDLIEMKLPDKVIKSSVSNLKNDF